MDNQIYVVCNQTSSFKDIQLFRKETNNYNNTTFFYNKFKLYFNLFWYKYEYPFYSRNYYYDYNDYSGNRNKFTFGAYSVESITNSYNLFIKWVKHIKNKMKPLVYLFLSLLIYSCSIGTSFRTTDIRSFKGTLIPELSDKPILIEKFQWI